MTPREIARRADALMQGPETRRDICTMMAYRESDCDSLRRELGGEPALMSDLDAARKEIEKLRELVRLMGGPASHYTSKRIEQMRRELGLEVEG